MRRRRRVRTYILLCLLAAGIAGILLYTFSWRFQRIARGLITGRARNVTWLDDESAVRLVVSRSPLRVADYYAAPAGEPLVVLVHGSDPAGRRDVFVRLFAARLQRAGIAVLAPDLGGFGESEDPRTPLTRIGFEDDVLAAVRHAIQKGRGRTGRIVYAGHSLGAVVVLGAARRDPAPAAVVVLGAPETKALDAQGESAWRRFAARRLQNMGLEPEQASVEAMGRFLLERDVATLLAAGGLPPVLVVYGDEEAPSGRVRASVEGKNRLELVGGVGHRYGVTPALDGMVFYNRAVLDSLTDTVAAWVRRWADGPN